MNRVSILVLVFFATLTAFTFYTAKEVYTVDLAQSELHWYAKKVTGAHDGTVQLKSGSLEMDGGKLTGGSFVIDMTTITVTDISDDQGKSKLEGHLNSEDFFDVAQHNIAELTLKKVTKTGQQAVSDKAQEYDVTADLTIKGKTNEVTFKAYAKDGGSDLDARATIVFDRTKYDIRYASKSFFEGIGDRAIYDDIKLEVSLKASK